MRIREFEEDIINAARNGYTETVRLLLDRGVDPNTCDTVNYSRMNSRASCFIGNSA